MTSLIDIDYDALRAWYERNYARSHAPDAAIAAALASLADRPGIIDAAYCEARNHLVWAMRGRYHDIIRPQATWGVIARHPDDWQDFGWCLRWEHTGRAAIGVITLLNKTYRSPARVRQVLDRRA